MNQLAASTVEADRRTAWSSWHLHLASAARSVQDRVIQEVIRPVTAGLDGHPWFFMRYWQGGTHLRFRVGDLSAGAFGRVEAELTERLAVAGRLADGETRLDEATYLAGAGTFAATERGTDRTVRGLLPAGVHRAVYEPEYERYGGVALMPRTERLFQLSSALVLALLPAAATSRVRTQLAVRGTLSAAAALGDRAEQAAFYERSMTAWRGWAAASGCTPAELDRLCTVDATATRPDPSAHGPFTAWHAALAELAGVLTATGDTPAGQILFSHVHMLHNRLGRSMFEELRTYAWLAHVSRAGEPV